MYDTMMLSELYMMRSEWSYSFGTRWALKRCHALQSEGSAFAPHLRLPFAEGSRLIVDPIVHCSSLSTPFLGQWQYSLADVSTLYELIARLLPLKIGEQRSACCYMQCDRLVQLS